MVIFKSHSNEMDSSELSRVETTATQLQPEDFLTASKVVSKQSLGLLKSIYDLTKISENEVSSSPSSRFNPLLVPSVSSSYKASKKNKNKKEGISPTEAPLTTLIVKDFDEDQIWEFIQLQNSLIYETLVTSVSKILAHKNRPKVEEQDEDEDSGEELLRELEHVGKISDDNDEDLSDFFENDKPKKKSIQSRSYAKSVVDDKFFNLAQMTEFVDKMDAEATQKNDHRESDGEDEEEEDNKDDDSIDLFKDDEDVDEEDYFYKDFFDPPLKGDASKDGSKALDTNEEDQEDDDEEEESLLNSKKSVRFNLEDDHEEKNKEDKKIKFDVSDTDSEDEASMSNFEKRRRKIEKDIKEMEQEALKPRSWQLTGEVTAQTRPENSLLEEHLVYDHLIRQAPEITVKTTQKLEDIIKQRVKDQAWDDVVRKIKPIENPFEYKKRLVLDAEKSKASLAEIYEKEFIEKQKQNDGEAEEEKEPEEHKQIQKELRDLVHKLDALSNFHFTPTPTNVEIKIVSNVPAVTLEEVGPMAVSDAMLLAPQEIQEPTKGEIKSKAERTKTDMKRERRLKKKKQHLKRLSQEEKARERGIGLRSIKLADNVVKKSKDKGDEGYHNSKELKSSKAFFAKLQDQVHSHIDSVAKRKKASTDAKALTAKRFKM